MNCLTLIDIFWFLLFFIVMTLKDNLCLVKKQTTPNNKNKTPNPHPCVLVLYSVLYTDYYFHKIEKPNFDNLSIFFCMFWVSITANNQALCERTLTHPGTLLTWFSLKQLMKLINYVSLQNAPNWYLILPTITGVAFHFTDLSLFYCFSLS